jgi:uncharacterized repeat protein (TIGR01451 family)/CSLREA domain-containing protein
VKYLPTLICALILICALPVPGVAAIITVDTLDDVIAVDGQCSLREAIINANNGDQSGSVDCADGTVGADTIVFEAALAGGTLVLNGEQLPTISAGLTIEGPEPGDPSGLTIDGDDGDRILRFSGDFHAELKDLTLTGGRATSLGGGAIRADGSQLTLRRVVVSDNEAEQVGGGGIIMVLGELLMIDSVVTGNYAAGSGGGIYLNNVLTTLENTIVSGNSVSQWGGGLRILSGSEVELIRTAVTGNTGGGLSGGIHVSDSTLSMVNVTVSGNIAGSSVGIYASRSTLTLLHSTVAWNIANFTTNPHGITLFGDDNGAAWAELINSVIAQPDGAQPTCSAGGTDSGFINNDSLATHASCTGTATPVAEINLGPLTDNGGPTPTHSLFPGSIAIDGAGDCFTDHGINDDQRGLPRPGGDSVACDIGAFEVQEPPPEADLAIAKSVAPELVEPGQVVTFTLQASNLGPDEATGVTVIDQLPAGYTFVDAVATAGSFDEISGNWDIGSLSAGSVVELNIEVIVNPSGPYLNSASISGLQPDPDANNNEAQAGVTLLPPPSGPIVVDTLADVVAEDGQCSLREAIINANSNDHSGSVDCQRGVSGADTITFDASLVGGTIVLDGTRLPNITEPLTIEGPVAGDPRGIILDGNGESGIVYISGSAGDVRQLTLSSLTLTGGASGMGGGGVYASYTDLDMADVVVVGNQAVPSSNGGGIRVGRSSLLMERTLVRGNYSGGMGGGIMATDSSIELINTTVSGNTAAGNAGGIGVNRSAAILRHATVAFNTNLSSIRRDGIYITGTSEVSASLQLHATLVVQEGANERGCATGAYSTIESTASMATGTHCTGEATPLDAIRLGALAFNGAPLHTHLLGAGSAAIDAAGDCLANGGIDHDQRSRPRPGGQSGACDIGAYEDQGDDPIFSDRF